MFNWFKNWYFLSPKAKRFVLDALYFQKKDMQQRLIILESLNNEDMIHDDAIADLVNDLCFINAIIVDLDD